MDEKIKSFEKYRMWKIYNLSVLPMISIYFFWDEKLCLPYAMERDLSE